ncbi:hypothetical protein N9S30_00230 [bacterium]|nr:hypothetical protein [bacterium]
MVSRTRSKARGDHATLVTTFKELNKFVHLFREKIDIDMADAGMTKLCRLRKAKFYATTAARRAILKKSARGDALSGQERTVLQNIANLQELQRRFNEMKTIFDDQFVKPFGWPTPAELKTTRFADDTAFNAAAM